MKRTAKSISPANFLAKSVVAGQTNTVVHLGSIDFAKHSMRQLIQRLTVDEHLQWADECTTVPYGITVPGFACWADTLGTIVNGTLIDIACCAYAVLATAACTPFRCPW